MSVAKHTPGPWLAERAVDMAGFETGKVWIIMRGAPCAYDFDRFEDAQLAAAAPDLLDALAEITPPMPPVDAPCHNGVVEQSKCAHCGRIAAAHAAIAKATGQ